MNVGSFQIFKVYSYQLDSIDQVDILQVSRCLNLSHSNNLLHKDRPVLWGPVHHNNNLERQI